MMFRSMALVALLGAPLFAQDYQAYFEEFDVVLYQLQVNVLDRDGKPIRGLSKEDFQLFIDNEIQSLESVEEFDLKVYNEDPTKEIPQQARRLFVFLFDLKYTTKQGVLQARDAAKKFVLEDMKSTDLVSVFTYNPLSGVSMLTNFTSNTDHLLQAIDWMGLSSTQNVVQGPSGYFFNARVDELVFDRDSQLAAASREGTEAADQLGEDADRNALEHYIEIAELGRRAEQKMYQREVSTFLGSFGKFADGLRLIRGRKNLVWFSTGFDSRSLSGGSVDEIRRNNEMIERGEFYNVSDDQFGSGNIQNASRDLVEKLQSSGTVIFSIDTTLSGDVSSNKVGLSSLNMLASDTGGRLYNNYNDLSTPLNRIEDLTDNYYVLSFYPNAELDKGEVGDVKIKLKDRRAKIYTTKGIMVEPDFNSLTTLEKQIHLSEYIGRDQLASGIPIKTDVFMTPQDKDLVKATVGVEMRGDYFLGHKLDKARPIEIHTLAISKETDTLFDRAYSSFQLQPGKVKDTLEKTGAKYFTNLFLKEGEYKLKIVVRDLENGKVGSAIQYVTVTNTYDAIFGPTLVTKEDWLILRESDKAERQRRLNVLDVSYPYAIGGDTFVPSATPIVSADGREQFFFLVSGDASMADEPPRVTALLMDKEGQITPIPVDAMNGDADFRGGPRNVLHFLLDVDLSKLDLKAGQDYQLMAQFKTKGGANLRTAGQFSVE